MSENLENYNIEDDANMKFGKLCEIVQDIEVNGQEGDQFSRQAVFSGILASKNDVLWNKLEETLLKDESSELMKTVLVGLLMQKGNTLPLCQYSEKFLKEVITLNEEFENKESLLLIADALVKGTDSDDEDIRDKSIKHLLTLYKAACHPDSTAIIADQLLQRFINILPNKNKVIDDNLLQLVKNIEEELNSRVISVDILGRSQPAGFFEDAVDLVCNIEDYSKNSIEKMYFLDVLTKYIYNAAISNIGISYSSTSRKLSDIEVADILTNAKAEYGSDNEHLDVISKRILRRISQLNELTNSQN